MFLSRIALVIFVFAVPFLVPRINFAETQCSPDNYTIVYINGISTTRSEAGDDTDKFRAKFMERSGRKDVKFLVGYNQTHLAGFGDKVKAVMQTYLTDEGRYIEDYDLKTILME
ncbi:MAG: hypothetical protein RLZZ342_210, partial [Candidatus Parcubacteria bacterium]